MKRDVTAMLALLAVLLTQIGTVAHAADVTANLDYNTAYIFRGETVNDRSVLQPYVEISPEDTGFLFGVWANYNAASDSRRDIDLGINSRHSEFSEVDFYLSYELPLKIPNFALALGYNEYMYPNSDSKADRELAIIAAFDTELNPQLAIYPGVGGAFKEAVFMEATIGHQEEVAPDFKVLFGSSVGVQWQGEESTADDGFSFARVTTGVGYQWLRATVSYYFETDKEVLEVDRNWLGTVGAHLKF